MTLFPSQPSLKKLWFNHSYDAIQQRLDNDQVLSHQILPIISAKHMHQFDRYLQKNPEKIDQALQVLAQLIQHFVHPSTRDHNSFKQAQKQHLTQALISQFPRLFSYPSAIHTPKVLQSFQTLLDHHPDALQLPFLNYSTRNYLMTDNHPYEPLIFTWIHKGIYFEHTWIDSMLEPFLPTLPQPIWQSILVDALPSSFLFSKPFEFNSRFSFLTRSFSYLSEHHPDWIQHHLSTLWSRYQMTLFYACNTDSHYKEASRWLLERADHLWQTHPDPEIWFQFPVTQSYEILSKRIQRGLKPMNYYHAEWFYDFSQFCAQKNIDPCHHPLPPHLTLFYNTATFDQRLSDASSRAHFSYQNLPSFRASRFSFQSDNFKTAFQAMQSYHQLNLMVQSNPSRSTSPSTPRL